MKEFMLAYLLETEGIEGRFQKWPLHITLLPWFEAPEVEPVVSQLQSRLRGMAPVKTETTERAYFGAKQLPVMLVEPTPNLEKLHFTLLDMVNTQEWSLQGRYTGKFYRPHVTQKAEKDASGRVVIDRVYLIQALAQGYRYLHAEVLLDG